MSDGRDERRRRFLAGEPLPGGHKVRMSGDEIKRKVKSGELRQGPIRHAGGLDAVLTKWARSLYERVGRLMYPSFEQWELGFMRDTRPHQELFVWEAIAQVHKQFVADHPDCDQSKVLGTIAALSTGATLADETRESKDLAARWEAKSREFDADPGEKFKQIADELGLDKG